FSISADDNFIQLYSGQIIETEKITQVGFTGPGIPRFDDSGSTVYVANGNGDLISAYDVFLGIPSTTYPLSCPSLGGSALEFTLINNNSGFLVLSSSGVCANLDPENGYLYFANESQQASENSAAVAVEICRGGNANGSITGILSSAQALNSTYPAAVSGEDYTPISDQSISFSDGETGCKSVDIQIIDDNDLSGEREFAIELIPSDANSRIGRATGSPTDPYLLTPKATVNILILEDEPDIAVGMSVQQPIVVSGELRTLSVSVANISTASPPANTVVTIPLPETFEFVSTSSPNGNCTISESIVCHTGDIAGTESIEFDITLRIIGAGLIPVTAIATTNVTDHNQSNNQIFVPLTINPIPNADTLMPLIPGTRWFFQSVFPFSYAEEVLATPVDFGGTVATGVEFSDSGIIEYYANTNGLHTFATVYPNGDRIETSPGIKIMNETPHYGDVLSSSGNLLYELNGIDLLSFPYTATAVVEDFSLASLPYGQGTQWVARVVVTIEASGESNGYFLDSTLRREYRFAKGLGRISFSETHTDNFTQQTNFSNRNLVSYEYPDSDGDGLTDELEIIYDLDRERTDTDKDGLSDGDEITVYFTNALLFDSDNDGFSDGYEVANDTNPLDPNSIPPEIEVTQIPTISEKFLQYLFIFAILFIGGLFLRSRRLS
ncbi:MAG: Calx-beta domain-containing protein, partial [Pseudomonadota bacterium]